MLVFSGTRKLIIKIVSEVYMEKPTKENVNVPFHLQDLINRVNDVERKIEHVKAQDVSEEAYRRLREEYEEVSSKMILLYHIERPHHYLFIDILTKFHYIAFIIIGNILYIPYVSLIFHKM